MSTANKIKEAARQQFNARGYVATSLTEIAAIVGISQGNLTYHFSTKSDLASAIQAEAQEAARARRSNRRQGDIADDYVDHLVFAMTLTWNYLFLLRDRIHFEDKLNNADSEFEADFAELHMLLKRVEAEGLFRKGAVDDITILARSIWVMSRYWIDYLRDFEHLQDIQWSDQIRGIEHHFALLLPCLIAAGQREFRAALERVTARSELTA